MGKKSETKVKQNRKCQKNLKSNNILDQLKEKQKLSWEGMFYSAQRLDLLIVTISGAGVYAILETMKFLVSKDQEVEWILKIAGVLFITSVIVNLFSQVYGHKSNTNDFLMHAVQIRNINKKDDPKVSKTLEEYNKIAAKYEKWTNRSNNLSLSFLITGLLCILFFFLFIFQ